MTDTKTCTSCGQVKPLAEFHLNRTRGDGYMAQCKVCTIVRRAEYRERNRSRINLGKSVYHRSNPHMKWRYRYEERAKSLGHLPIVEGFTRDDVIAAYGDACAHCGGPFEELDHYPLPVSQGGPHTLENVRPSCTACNRRTWRQGGNAM